MRKLAALTIILSLAFLVQSLFAHAERLDAGTETMVIQKLEAALPGLKGEKSEPGVLIRLGDLYSERARLKAIDEENTKCTTCDGSKNDRTKAISYYIESYNRIDGETKTHALMQITHLYTIEGENKKAEGLFKTTLADKTTSRDVRGECLAGLGELYFRTGRFNDAQKNFEESLKYEIKNPTFVNYRLSWCYFNAGKSAEAKAILVSALKSKVNLDPSFQKDMARDLATFIARDGISNASIDELTSLSPDTEKKSNLFYLGQEADRLGNKSGSLLVWQHYSAMGAVANDESLEIQIRTAQTLWDQGLSRSALDLYTKFYAGLAKADCKAGENCDDLRARSRVFVHSWIKKEKTKPTEYLFDALKIYVQNNPHDVEMVQWAGHVARRLKQTSVAAQYYAMAANESAAQLRASDLTPAKKTFLSGAIENSLLAEMECAEEANDKPAMIASYQHYMTLRPDGTRHFQVLYQIAHLKYENKQYADAANEFDRIAVDSKCSDTGLKTKAADLALDSWANLGDVNHVESRSKVYASSFPSRQNSYYAVSRKASVNSAIGKFSQKTADTAQVSAALAQISAAPLAGASNEERVSIYKNQILMAQKINDLSTADRASKNMLEIKKLSVADEDFALNAQLWVSEARLDFDHAFQVAKKIHTSNEKADAQYLKLALLADLSGHNSLPYYDKFLRTTRNMNQASIVYAKMIQESRNPWRTLNIYKKSLQKTPEIYGASVLEAFAKLADARELRKYMNDRQIRRSSSYSTIARFVQLSDDKVLDHEFAQTRLSHQNDLALQKSFKNRMKLLKEAEHRANYAIARNDFTLEVIDLSRVASQYERLAREFSSLPIPKTLKKKDRKEYARLIQIKISPFKRTAEAARAKIAALWVQSGAMAKLMELSQTESGGARKLLISDLRLLQKYAPQNQQRNISQALNQASHTPSNIEIAKAKSAVQSKPFDSDKIEALRKLEVRRNELPMVVFLEARLASLPDTSKGVAR
jgi:hypothetical protein